MKDNRKKPNYKRQKQGNRDVPNKNVKDDSCRSDSSRSDRGNHISWYVPSDELLRQVGAISFGDPMGLEADGSQYSEPIPGIAVFNWVPTYATSYQAQLDLTVAMNKMWADIRSHNSRSATYQPADLMLYLLSMDNVYILYTMAVRAYGIIRHYSVFNRYLAKSLVEACGFDYDSLIANLDDFRYQINMMAMRLNHIPVPATMPLISKHAWMSNNVWRETDSPKSQLYLFRPSYLYAYTATKYDTGGALEKVNLADYMGNVDNLGAGMSITQFADLVNRLVQPIAYDDDFTYIAGDIIKAYGEGSFFYMQEIPEGFVTPITTMENDQDAYEVFVGIHNADILNPTNLGDVTQSDGNQLSQPFSISYEYDGEHGTSYENNYAYEVAAQMYGLTHRRWIDIIKPDPSPANVMYATRYMAGNTEISDNEIREVDIGTEAITNIIVYLDAKTADYAYIPYIKFGSNYVATNIPASALDVGGGNSNTFANMQLRLDYMLRTTAFRYLPALCPVVADIYDGTNPQGTNPATPSRIWSIEYATTTDPYSITKLHSVARLNEFGINLFSGGKSVSK